MKTIAYMDICDGRKVLRGYSGVHLTKNKRIAKAFKELKGLGNIAIYYCRNHKARMIGVKRI